jgi:hypothetical protein
VFFVFDGTAANSRALSSLCESYHGIICHESAHVETDECGTPEFFSHGTKVQLAPGHHGKLAPTGVETLVLKRRDIHHPENGFYTNISTGVDFRSRLRGSGVSPDMERHTPAGETPALHFRSLKGIIFWY